MGKHTEVSISNDRLQTAAGILRALAHPLRLRILEFIDQNQSVNVNKIYNTLELEQSITSQHLRILRLAGIVKTKRDGKYIHYSINYGKVFRSVDAIVAFLEKNGKE